MNHQYQQWAVVLFMKDSSISTVPSKWLSSPTGEDQELECFWPNKKIRQHIQNASDANEEEWVKFRIRILHETDDYNLAKNFEKTCSEGESSDNMNVLAGSRKRKCVKDRDFISGDVSSSEDDFDLSALPKVPKKMDTPQKNGIGVHQVCPKNSEVLDNGSDTSSSSTSVSLNDEETLEMDKITMPPPSITRVIRKHTQSDDNGTDDCCCVHIKRLNEHVVILRTLLDEHSNNLKKIILPQASVSVTNIDSFETIPQDAFKKHKQLMKYENVLQNSETARKQLETLFFIGGGNFSNDLIKRGLMRMFSNKLAMKFSWYGRKNNYPLNNLIIISTLKDAARKRFPSMSDSEFEKHTATWFRQATLRFKRETIDNNPHPAL